MKTYSAKADDIHHDWLVVDAEDKTLGRLATEIAHRLRGKHKPEYTPHMDMGDNVIVINAEKVHLTGNKRDTKTYYWHTGYPGGIKSRVASDMLVGKFPERVIEKAVKRMLPGGPLSRKQMTNLRIYKGESHPHEGQSPEIFKLKDINEKNTRRVR